MDRFSISLLLVCYMFFHFEARHGSGPQAQTSSEPFVGGYQLPINFHMIGALAVLMFLLCLCRLILTWSYFRPHESFYNGSGLIAGNSNPAPVTVTELWLAGPGLQRAVIQSLPKFQFSSLKGAKDGMECSVCLSWFKDFEVLRSLPRCKHAFHVKCIDRWLEKNSSCPLCRDIVEISSNRSIIAEEHDTSRTGHGTDGRGDSNTVILVERDEHSRFLGFSSDVREQLTDDGVEMMHRGTPASSTARL